MAYEPKPGQFSLFKNNRKEKDSHPDYKGDGVDLDGNAVWVSAWLKEGKNGKYMSCQLKLKEAKSEEGYDRQLRKAGMAQQSQPAPFDDDVPFMRHTSNYSF